MKYDDVVKSISTIPVLNRIASAYVVDHRNLNEKELRDNLIKVRAQYLDSENIENSYNNAMYEQESLNRRVLTQLIIEDVLLNAHGFILPIRETGEKVIAFEQMIIDRSNELDLISMAYGQKGNERHEQLILYKFVLEVAWEYQDTKSRDEANLLRKLRNRLKINEWKHRLIEAKLGKYPKPGNEIHKMDEIENVRKFLQSKGLIFSVRDDDNEDYDVIPEEIAEKLRKIIGIEIRPENYFQMLQYKKLRYKSFLRKALDSSGLGYSPYEKNEDLMDRVIRNIKPSILLGCSRVFSGLHTDDLYKWCNELGMFCSGTKQEKISRIIKYYDNLKIKKPEEDDRAQWYDFFETLAIRDYKNLRNNGIIVKDIETESKFEDATTFLFDNKLHHSPLKQPGVNRPDGLLSFKDMYIMWDCKSKESPGEVHLKEHIKQFHDYIENADRHVPIFLVIAPGFSLESEVEALQYSAKHIGRSILLITAKELKELAVEWSSQKNKRRDEPFPVGLFNRTGRYNRALLGKLF